MQNDHPHPIPPNYLTPCLYGICSSWIDYEEGALEVKIETRVRASYYSPTANRSFLTKEAAANAEARALITRKYPTEKPHWMDGPNGYHWHWTEDERLCRVFTRLSRIIRRSIK